MIHQIRLYCIAWVILFPSYMVAQYQVPPCNIIRTNDRITETTSPDDILKKYVPFLKAAGSGIIKTNETATVDQTIITFQPTYRDMVLFPCQIKIVLRNQIATHVMYNIPDTFTLSDSKNDVRSLGSVFINDHNVVPYEVEKAGFFISHLLTPCYKIKVFDSATYEKTEYVISQSHEIYYQSSLKYYHRKMMPPDSTVPFQTSVFYPDPLTSSNSLYGSFFKDCDNKDSGDINLQQQVQWTKGRLKQDSIFLETDYFRLHEISPPGIEPTVITNMAMPVKFNRSENGFEDINAFYHITRYQEYIKSMGYQKYLSLLWVDTHALNGVDQSAFDSDVFPNTLEFGTGGVDDAEDADVLIHECTHGLSFNASPYSNHGDERKAIDEALSDYMALSYSRDISPNQPGWVYNWDGHNEFWDGRITNTSKVYPSDLSGNIYIDGELLSSPLAVINNTIGREITDKMVLLSMAFLSAGMTMTQFAEIVLYNDSVLYDAQHVQLMKSVFKSRKLLGYKDQVSNMSGHIEMLNSEAFADGTGNLIIRSDNPLDAEICSVTGDVLFSGEKVLYILLSPSEFMPGIYILTYTIDGKPYSTKLLKR